MKNMKNLSKRGLAMLLVLIMCLGMTNMAAFAAEGDETTPDVAGENINIDVITVADTAADAEPADEVADADETDETEESAADAGWDITDTERPAASETVDHNTGTSDDKVDEDVENSAENRNWEIFYDAQRDVYKITFNIGSDAEGTQVIDLTQALELLGEYAESGKQELEAAIADLEKPEMGVPDVEKPVEPGKPEGLDEALQNVWDELFDDLSGENNDNNLPENVLAKMAEMGIDTNDQYVQDYANYLVDKADNAFLIKVFETRGEVGSVGMFNFFVQMNSNWNGRGEPTDEQVAQAIASVQRQDSRLTAPVYAVDTTTEAYQAYVEAMAEYNAALAEIEAKYADAKAEYDAAVAELTAEFERRLGANVLEPGDVKKFELFITSDSLHTYKYTTGSFTLATPGWTVNPDGTVTGFDGQILPDEYVDHASYNVTVRSEPIQALYDAIGLDDFDKFNGHPGWANYDIKKFLADYEGNTLAEQLNSYILAYYNDKDGTEYTTINELVQNNADARAELTKTETSGNKWFSVSGETFVVDAHLETVKYDNFYKNLFSFAFGSEADINKILGEAKFNEATNRWEYENDSWTANDYQLALYYYMDHKEIWQKTDAYFNALLDSGLSADQATWTSLMMALNIDGELTGNDWQNTQWPWYSSIQLERVDIDFSLTKQDGETGETITSSETEFQVYYINTVKNEDGTETDVKMYCTASTDDEGNVSYTFVTTESTVWTKNGELNISYAMMKDIVYYLQEMTAPEGYERDTNVYIVMSEEDYNKLSEEDKAALEGTFDEFLDLAVSPDGLSVSTNFVNVKIVTPSPTPENPPENPPEEPEPPEDPNEPPEEVEEPDVPLANLPEDPEEEIPDEDVPLADAPQTGDDMGLWLTAAALSAMGLMAMLNKRKEDEEA